MSVEKSTIDRFGGWPIASRSSTSSPGPRTASPETHELPGAPAKAGAAAPTALVPSPGLRRLFALLERRSPRAGGRLAERLWFRLPPRPAAATRAGRTPTGGEAFEVTWAGGVVRGRVYGHWGNPTAYLVHGWGGWWQQLSAHVERLQQAGLCVVAFDAPSHGDSGAGAFGRRSTTFVEMAQALAAVVAEFGRPTLVVAHSAGALAALHACSLGVRPEAYVLIAPPRSVEPMVQVFSRSLGVGPRSLEVMVDRAERRVGLPIAALDLITMASREHALPPVLVVHDRRDREAPVAGAVAIATAWHGARLLLTDGLGHRRVMWDTAVVDRVESFAAAAAESVRRSSR
jgi:pimeloyl-ACP methyl ester carboxylesterase